MRTEYISFTVDGNTSICVTCYIVNLIQLCAVNLLIIYIISSVMSVESEIELKRMQSLLQKHTVYCMLSIRFVIWLGELVGKDPCFG